MPFTSGPDNDGDASDEGQRFPRVDRRGFVGGLGALLAGTAFTRSIDAEMAAPVVDGDASPSHVVTSPNGALAVTFDVADGTPRYHVEYDGRTVLSDSAIGFEFRDQPPLTDGFVVTGSTRTSFDETWTPVWDQHETIRERYESLRVGLVETDGRERALTVAIRVFDDGVGFRVEFPRDSGVGAFAITSERTEFAFPDDPTAWWIQNDFNSYEYAHETTPLSELHTTSPTGGAHTPLTMQRDDGLYLSLHEADLVDYAAMGVTPQSAGSTVLESTLAPMPDGTAVLGNAPHRTPWRTLQVAEQPGELIESNLIVNLNEPLDAAAFPDGTDWIEPQKFLGIWWLMITNRADWQYHDTESGNHGAQTGRMKQYMKFASEHDIPSVLVEGWNDGWRSYPGDGSAMDFDTTYPDFDLDAVTAFGKQLDPPVEMTAHNETAGAITNYESQLEADSSPFATYEHHGIHSIKTGYVADDGVTIDGATYNHHCQPMVNHHRLVYKQAAKHRQLLEIHEPIKPTGERRTYPNVMTREGVLGQEYDAFGRIEPSHHVTLPFTRMLAGPMEYTPGIFDLDSGAGGIETTRAKQLAMYPVYFSGLQMVADLPSSYLADQPATIEPGTVTQAEFGQIEGFETGARWANAQGERYVRIDPNTAVENASVAWTVTDDVSGEYDLHLRCANDAEDNAVGRGTPRTATIVVDGEHRTQVIVPETDYWNDWTTLSTTLSIDDSATTVAIELTDDDTGGFNLDAVGLSAPGELMGTPARAPIRGPTVPAFDFIEAVPAGSWDETRVLGGEIGEHVVVARRHGEEWFVGAMTDENERVQSIGLEFLDGAPGRRRGHGTSNGTGHHAGAGDRRGHTKGTYVAEIYADGPDATFPDDGDAVAVYERLVRPDDTITVSMVHSGGQAIRIRPATASDLASVPRYGAPSQTYDGGTIPDTAVINSSFISVSGTNEGNVVGGEELTITVDGAPVDTALARFGPGANTQTLSFSLSSPGTYEVAVETPDGTTITSNTVTVHVTDGEQLAVWRDATGDDHGPGSYTYPTGEMFEDGVLDLSEVALYEQDDRYQLIYWLDGPVTNPWNVSGGYSLQLLQLYVRDPTVGSAVPATTTGRAGTNVTFERPYHYRVIAAGGLQTVENAAGDTITEDVHTRVHSSIDAIEVTFPKQSVGGALEEAELAVLLFGADGYQSGHVRPVQASNATYLFGGGRDDNMNPNVIDMLTPEDTTQTAVLDYSDTENAIIPFLNR
ncbi:glycoside hydrolase family 97 catalytic domain-containing protein [Halocatena halophila]|uniref:glycoside hydrolase family 97 catalytic domain-containing protein n=1 Tax=Halocatena halophila TaxID=2814576 RepID=UPI002ED54DAE